MKILVSVVRSVLAIPKRLYMWYILTTKPVKTTHLTVDVVASSTCTGYLEFIWDSQELRDKWIWGIFATTTYHPDGGHSFRRQIVPLGRFSSIEDLFAQMRVVEQERQFGFNTKLQQKICWDGFTYTR